MAGATPPSCASIRGSEIYTVVDYRNRYAQYKSDPDLMAAHASAPFIVSFDDHEVDNDYAGDQDEQGTPPELFLLRRAAAYQAYYETMPLRRAAMPTGSNMRLFRRLQFGKLIDLSILDTRQYRSKQACGGGSKPACAEATGSQAGRFSAASRRSGCSKTWRAAQSTWTVLGQQVPTFARDCEAVDPAARFSMDKWDGYVAARNRLYARLKQSRARTPCVLSGDVHQHFGSDLKLDFASPDSETIGAEFTNTSITSGGDGADVSPPGSDQSGQPAHEVSQCATGLHRVHRDAAAMRADFKIVDRVTCAEPARSCALAGKPLVVEAGRPGAGTA